MLLHVTPESNARAIQRGGLRGVRRKLRSVDGVVELADSVYAMPVLPNFSDTFQWVRELRAWHEGRPKMVGVYFRVPRDTSAYVGCWNEPHALLPIGQAIRRVMQMPRGAELVLPGRIRPSAIHAIRPIPQLVGWQRHHDPKIADEVPGWIELRQYRGLPDWKRRQRAAFEKELGAIRTGDRDGQLWALSRMEVILEERPENLDAGGLGPCVEASDQAVRLAVARTLGWFRCGKSLGWLVRLAADADGEVRDQARYGLIRRREWGELVELVGRERVADAIVSHRDKQYGSLVSDLIAASWETEFRRSAVGILVEVLADDDTELFETEIEALENLVSQLPKEEGRTNELARWVGQHRASLEDS